MKQEANFKRFLPTPRRRRRGKFLTMSSRDMCSSTELYLRKSRAQKRRYEVYFDHKNRMIKLVPTIERKGTFLAQILTKRYGAAKFRFGSKQTGMPIGRYWLVEHDADASTKTECHQMIFKYEEKGE